MINSRPEETAEMVVQALARAGQRGVLSAGWGGLKAADLPKSVFMIGSVPFDWLFPRTAAVVHHGGAGTTSMGLRAGIPSIITPFMGDQPFWSMSWEWGQSPFLANNYQSIAWLNPSGLPCPMVRCKRAQPAWGNTFEPRMG